VVRKKPAPRKRRTRQHVIADQSVNHVERLILDEGYSAERPRGDYGYDLVLFTYDEQGYAEEGAVFIQIKATERLDASDAFPFDVDVRDYDRWTAELMPVILVLFDASRKRAYWLYVQRYFDEDVSRRPKGTAKTIRVRIPSRQFLGRAAVRRMRAHKQEALAKFKGAMDHA
jgi:hypothetical protein